MRRHIFDERFPVVKKDGGLFSGSVRVSISCAMYDGRARLSEETRDALGLFAHARLICCDACKTRFIAHFAARMCSPECRAAGRKKFYRKAIEKRSAFRAWKRKHGDDVLCKRCENAIDGAERRSRLFCSNACRQAAYRSASREVAT
jgi:hypothetical protein